jgi:hypothetical protein
MANFAELDENNVVLRVVSIQDKYENSGESYCSSLFGGKWKQTSYNGNIRKRYAGVGYTYDETLDAFIPPKPFDSWVLDESIFDWVSPIEKPVNYFSNTYEWREELQDWFSIRKYVYDTYASDYEYSHIQHAVENFNLTDFDKISILSTENYTVKFERIKNFITSHVVYKNWSTDVFRIWKYDYIENVLKKARCDLFAFYGSKSQENLDRHKKFMEMSTDYIFIECKNMWNIYKRDKYIE